MFAEFSKYLVVAAAAGLVGCGSLSILTGPASKVRVIDAERAAACEKLREFELQGSVNLGRINRELDKVEGELRTKAIIRAGEYNATGLVILTEITKDGNQTFAAYDCPRKRG